MTGKQHRKRSTVDASRFFQQPLFDTQTGWGQKIFPDADSAIEAKTLATGIEVLDESLAMQGIPHGQITALAASGTSGMTTLAYHIVANAQQQTGQSVVYINLDETFDFYYASDCGIDLKYLLFVQPSSLGQALSIACDFIKETNIRLLILDLGVQTQQVINAEVQIYVEMLVRLVQSCSCALICLLHNMLSAVEALFITYARLVLTLRWHQWLHYTGSQHNIIGCESQVTIVEKSDLPVTKIVTIPIYFRGVHLER